jgi:hypothetical protein
MQLVALSPHRTIILLALLIVATVLIIGAALLLMHAGLGHSIAGAVHNHALVSSCGAVHGH